MSHRFEDTANEGSPLTSGAACSSLLQDRTSCDNPGGEDKGSDTHVHEGGAPGFNFGKPPREQSKVDCKDGGECDDHHAASVRREERLDGEDVQLIGSRLGLGISRDLGLLLWRDGVWGKSVDQDSWHEEKEVEKKWRAGVESDGEQDRANVEKKVDDEAQN